MKRNNLTTAVIAGIAGVAGTVNMASAVNINPDGLGQVLIYPYYTVNAGSNTLLSVVNTRNEGKAVKVRFLEAYNSREVLDFNLYLSPFDVWTAALSGAATGPGQLATDDNSCTVPAIKTNGSLPLDSLGRRFAPFLNYAYTTGGYGQPSGNDSGPTNLERTREGHFEMIEMGVVTDATANKSLTALTHVASASGGAHVPKNCGQLVSAWGTGGYWSISSATDMAPPTGGLFGSAAIIQVSTGIISGYNADAVDGFSNSIANLHTNPGSLFPSLKQAETSPGVATSYVFNNGALIVSNYNAATRGIDAVSAVFMADAVYNEYVVSPGIGAASEWVVTFPTKRFYVDPGIVGTTPASFIPPFEEVFGGGLVSGKPDNAGYSCFQIGLGYYDREEDKPVGSVIFSPPPPTGETSLCWESQVLTFAQTGETSAILGSKLVSNVETTFQTGWMRLDLNVSGSGHDMRPSIDGDIFHGLPVTGFLAERVINANAVVDKDNKSILANYASLYRHRISRNCTIANGGACS